MITEQNLTKHELIGLKAKVTESRNKANCGIAGKIINETQKTITIRRGEPKNLFKSQVRLQIELPSGKKTDVDGNDIIGRPWERIKK